MAVTRVQVFYQIGEGSKWTNVYHVDAASLAAVQSAFTDNMKPALLLLLHPAARIVKVLISSMTDDTFIELSVEEFGISGHEDSYLPLFNCAKVLVQTAALGRPDVKFLKGYLTEEFTTVGQIESGGITEIASGFLDMISNMDDASAPLVSESGDAWGGVTVQPAIQMRQLHRRRRRTVLP